MSAATCPPGAPCTPTVCYDGGCPVCRREGWRLAALEGAYRAFLRVRRVWRRA